MAGVSPVIRIGDVAPAPEPPIGVEDTVYPVIVWPLVTVGAVNARVADVAPVFAAMPTVGAPGGAVSVFIILLAADCGPVPTELTAATLNV